MLTPYYSGNLILPLDQLVSIITNAVLTFDGVI